MTRWIKALLLWLTLASLSPFQKVGGAEDCCHAYIDYPDVCYDDCLSWVGECEISDWCDCWDVPCCDEPCCQECQNYCNVYCDDQPLQPCCDYCGGSWCCNWDEGPLCEGLGWDEDPDPPIIIPPGPEMSDESASKSTKSAKKKTAKKKSAKKKKGEGK